MVSVDSLREGEQISNWDDQLQHIAMLITACYLANLEISLLYTVSKCSNATLGGQYEAA